jgi:hypothetical protein
VVLGSEHREPGVVGLNEVQRSFSMQLTQSSDSYDIVKTLKGFSALIKYHVIGNYGA